eukprot:TRINITY_DN37638_c0_g1_i1.p1 TRINITY_DN37638_c0_g1~~TRINITY_DN37638_c0_g1_i1.p1  ORF type:complete len:737 (+),score=129.68 TRINITY_DN37638_c0_g1_i1:84-2294(+)
MDGGSRIASAEDVTTCLGLAPDGASLALQDCLAQPGPAWTWTPPRVPRFAGPGEADGAGAAETWLGPLCLVTAGAAAAQPTPPQRCVTSGLRVAPLEENVGVGLQTSGVLDLDRWSWDPETLHIRFGDRCLERSAGRLRLGRCLLLRSGDAEEDQNGRGAPRFQAWVLLPTSRPQVDILDRLAFPLRAVGRHIVDSHGQVVKLSGVNWYGAHMQQLVNNGLETAPLERIAATIKLMGFNSVRLPYALSMLGSTSGAPPDPPASVAEALRRANPRLHGLSALQIFDQTIGALTAEGLLVVLNNHVGEAGWCCNGSDGSALWHGGGYSTEDWLHSLTFLADRYKANPRVIGFDIRNEPRMDSTTGTLPWWGLGSWLPRLPGLDLHFADWRAAAARGAVATWTGNAEALVIVEGFLYSTSLKYVPERPLELPDECLRSRVLYSAHLYDFFWSFFYLWNDIDSFSWPWKLLPDFRSVQQAGSESAEQLANKTTMPYAEFEDLIGKETFAMHLQNYAPIWVGEFGGNLPRARGSWWSNLLRFLRETDASWSYWALDSVKWPPNVSAEYPEGKAESYGIFDASTQDYAAVVGWKLQDLISIQAPHPDSPRRLALPAAFSSSCPARLSGEGAASTSLYWEQAAARAAEETSPLEWVATLSWATYFWLVLPVLCLCVCCIPCLRWAALAVGFRKAKDRQGCEEAGDGSCASSSETSADSTEESLLSGRGAKTSARELSAHLFAK